MKHTFNFKDVILDFDYINETNPYLKGIVDWTDEQEVIVIPKNIPYQVELLLDNKE